METLLRYLDSVHPLSCATKDQLRLIVHHREVRKKEFLLKAGQICKSIYFIEKGLLRCFYLQGDHEVCSWFMKEGDVIASVESFFNQSESYESIQALEDSVLHFISHSDLQHLYEHFPEFNYVGRELVQHYYKLSEQRLYSLRMQRGLERFESLKNNYSELIQRVEQKYLASYLGITEQYLSMLKSVRPGKSQRIS